MDIIRFGFILLLFIITLIVTTYSKRDLPTSIFNFIDTQKISSRPGYPKHPPVSINVQKRKQRTI